MKGIYWGLSVICAIVVVGAIGFFGFAPSIAEKGKNTVAEHDPYKVSKEAQAFHDSLFIADLHADSTLWNRDLLTRGDYGHSDIPRMVEGNHALQVFTTVTKTPAGMNYEENTTDARDNITLLAIGQRWPVRTWTNLTERAKYQAQRLHDMAEAAPESFTLIKTKQDLMDFQKARINGDNIIGGLIGTEGSHALEGDLANVDVLYNHGFRMMSLHHFFDNKLGGSLHGLSRSGLTDFGKEVVKKIDSLPIVLDLSHSSEAVVVEALEITTHPVVISHTGTKGHCNSPRNIDDDIMKLIAQTGGVVGIGFWDAICDYTPSGVAKAIVAAIDLLGEDHVGLGSDFDGAIGMTFDVSELAAVTQALLNEGLSETTIRKIMGGNVLRVFSEQLPS